MPSIFLLAARGHGLSAWLAGIVVSLVLICTVVLGVTYGLILWAFGKLENDDLPC